MEKPGALMIAPIYRLLFDYYFLTLTEDQVAISYKTYKSSNEKDRQTIVDQKLTPGILTKKLRNLFTVRHRNKVLV